MIIKPYLDDWRVSWLVSKVTMWKMSPWSFFKGPMLIGSKTFDKGQENNIKPYTPWKINMEPTNLNMRNAHGVCCWTTITTYDSSRDRLSPVLHTAPSTNTRAGWWHKQWKVEKDAEGNWQFSTSKEAEYPTPMAKAIALSFIDQLSKMKPINLI